jgi:RNA polymerase sigma factor (sigma-70 family)
MFEGTSPARASATTAQWLDSPYLARAAARVAHQHGLGREDVQDLLQEIRIALWELGPEVIVGAAWVFQVAGHKAVDLVRRQARTRNRDRSWADWSDCSSHDLELDHLLHARVSQLPAPLRDFYDLRYRQGLSEREIARRLGLCRASVRWLDQRCRRRIARRTRAHR